LFGGRVVRTSARFGRGEGGSNAVIHYSCDLCGQHIAKHDRDRFIVHIEIRPADNAWELDDDDLGDDNLTKVSQILKESEANGNDLFDSGPIHMRFDLCPVCRELFLKNPFQCKYSPQFNFSKN
jgi:hypothetical protein